ncbi:MAG: VWA domain-containing protein [Thermoanaerobaculia bacterium]|nr:VWA domain-containing protein [Thermoanaerobaculia bacterium]
MDLRRSALLLCLGVTSTLAAQAPPPRFEATVAVSSLLVPVIVRTESGRYVDGLEREDFRLLIDGQSVRIEAVDRGVDAPVSIVFLQDLSGSMANGGKLEASREALGSLLAAAGPDDEFAIATFAGERLQVEVPYTGDKAALAEAMELWQGYGTTSLHDAVAWLPEISENSAVGNRVAILVTDGHDNSSRITPAEAVEIVRGARLPVYILGLDALGAPRREPTERDPDGPYLYADLLQNLAARSGGRYFQAADAEELTAAVQGILMDLRQRYVISVGTRAEGPKADHEIKVEIVRRGTFLLTHRRGYRGTAPLSPSRPKK